MEIRKYYRVHSRGQSEDSGRLSYSKEIFGLRNAVFKLLLNRLADNGVDTEGILPKSLNHCLPSDVSHADLWENLLHTPLRVSDSALVHILGLEPSHESSQSKACANQTIVYIRSFQLTVGQLRRVISLLCGARLVYEKTAFWSESLEGTDDSDVIFVRYVGKTTRGVLRRHREDLFTRKSGFLAKFLACLGRTYPEVLDSAVFYQFPTHQIPELTEPFRLSDLKEQAAIALLGPKFLLNQVLTDTKWWHFLPSDEHRKMFQELKIDTISRLDPSYFLHTSYREPLERWGDEVQRYAREHQSTVSIFRNRPHEFPDSLKDMIVCQAVPSALHGKFVLLLIVGAGISREGYREEQSFLNGSSASAIILKRFLDRLWIWEQPKCPELSYVDRLVASGALPFVDLCPWYYAKGEDLIAAAGFLKQYISLVNPLIMLTLAEKPSSVISSGLSSASRSPSSGFWSQVGHLQLVDLEGHCVIQVPCFHPGQARFFTNPMVFFIVLDMTLWVLLLTISVSLDSLALFETEGQEKFCNHVKLAVQKNLDILQFYDKFERLKETLHSSRSKKSRTGTVGPRDQWRIVVASRKDVDQDIYSGFAVDKPMSDRRRQQAYRLWELNIPGLHVHIGRDTRHEWIQWMLSVDEGVSLFIDSLAYAVWSSKSGSGNNQGRQTLSQVSIKESHSTGICSHNKVREGIQYILENNPLLGEKWTTYHDLVAMITTELSHDRPLWRWMHASSISDDLTKTGITRFKAFYRASLNETEVHVWQNFTFALYWQCSTGQRYKFIMRAPRSSQDKSYTQRKWIFFTKDGIDLRDGKGISCLVDKRALGSDIKVTFPVQHLPNCQEDAGLSQRLVELWEFETGLNWERITTMPPRELDVWDHIQHYDTDCLPQSFYVGNGLPLIRSNWSADKLVPYDNCPCPADETWLLWTCLKEFWPNGGTLFIGIPEKWPSRQNNIWTRFREFLCNPRYRHHPKIAQVRAWAGDISYTRKTSQMIKNIKYLCVVYHQKKIQERDRARLKEEGKDVKIAGTELEIMPKWRDMRGGSNNIVGLES